MTDTDFPERNINGLKVVIDRTTCIGSANCVKSAPEVFVLDEEKICSFVEEPENIGKDRIIEGCDVCPVNALLVYDENSKQIVP